MAAGSASEALARAGHCVRVVPDLAYVHGQADPERGRPGGGTRKTLRLSAGDLRFATGRGLSRRPRPPGGPVRSGRAARHAPAPRGPQGREAPPRGLHRPPGAAVPLKRIPLDVNVVLDFVLDPPPVCE